MSHNHHVQSEVAPSQSHTPGLAMIGRARWHFSALGSDLRAALFADSHHTLVLRCTAILLLLHGASWPGLQVPVIVLAGMLLVLPRLLTQPTIWWMLFASIAADTIGQWSVVDNHKYLITYWALACALSLHSERPQEHLNRTARLLVALVFLFATAWKLLGGQYLNGSFLYVTFVTDPRVQPVAATIAGTQLGDFTVVRQTVGFLGSLGLADYSVSLPNSERLRAFAIALSWLTLIVEGSVGVLHLFGSTRLYTARHGALMIFILGTYFLLPVLGFAFILTVLGLASCDEGDEGAVYRYLSIMGVIQVTLIPWRTLLIGG